SVGIGLGWSLILTVLGVAAFRGLVDVLAHKLIPAPSLFGAEDELREQDLVSRRRLWYWRRRYRQLFWIALIFGVAVAIALLIAPLTNNDSSLSGAISDVAHLFVNFVPTLLRSLPVLVVLFFVNFLILFGPLLFLGIQQIKGYEPGDADWG